MKKFFVSLFTLVSLFALGSPVRAESGLVKIADNVYSYVDAKEPVPANSYGANAGIVIGEKGVLVIDTLISLKEGKRLINDIRKITDKPVRYVVNTHHHLDHAFGNSEFAELGATIIAHKNGRAAMEKSAEATLKSAKDFGLTEKDMEGTKIAYPDLTFNERMEVDLGNVTVEILYVTHSHTRGSVLVYVVERKVLFTGDILFTDFHPYMADGSIDGWVRTLDYIMTLGAGKIIPGHGPVSGEKDVLDMKAYLIAFDKNARKLASESGDLDFIAEEIKKSLPSKTRLESLIKTNIQLRYLKKDK